jgi:4-amino-4-deoxychorismate lyase
VEGALRGSAAPGLRLIETFGWTPEHGFARLAAHLARLEAGAAALGVALAPGAAEAAALRAGRGPAGLRLRLTVGLGGDVAVEAAPLPAPRPAWTAALAAQTLRADDPWLRVKTTRRPAYDAARAALQAGVDEAILLNERGEVCDGTITTVFVDLGAGLVTPPLAAGVLPGVLRAELIAAGAAREAALAPGDLRRGRLYLGNSLRGLIPARMAG